MCRTMSVNALAYANGVVASQGFSSLSASFLLSLSLQSISGSHEFLSTLVNPLVFKSIYVQDYFLISITRESKIYKFPSMAN